MNVSKPNRVTRSYTQRPVAGPSAEFPLLCPVREAESGSEALATYTHTSLGPRGDIFVASFTEDSYLAFMKNWEARIKHYLLHGVALRIPGG